MCYKGNKQQYSSMSKFRQICQQFAKHGYPETSNLTEYELNAALDKILQSKMPSVGQFDRELAQQLFQRAKKGSQKGVILRDYIGVMLHAHAILEQHIKGNRELIIVEKDQEKKEVLQEQILQFQNQLRLLREPFDIQVGVPTLTDQQKHSLAEKEGLKAGPAEVGLQKSKILSLETSQTLESASLVLILVLALISLPFELLNSATKPNFPNVLTTLMLLAIFTLNYFDKLYIRACIIAIAATLLLDIFWAAQLSKSFWNPTATHRSALRKGYLQYTVVMTAILMLVRLIIAILIYRYRNNRIQTKEVVRLGGAVIELSGDGARNPLALAMAQGNMQIGFGQ